MEAKNLKAMMLGLMLLGVWSWFLTIFFGNWQMIYYHKYSNNSMGNSSTVKDKCINLKGHLELMNLIILSIG